MNLADICAASATQLSAMDREALADQCLQVGNILHPIDNTWALVAAIGFAGATAIAVLIHRLVIGSVWYAALLESLEALLFGAAAGYAGVAGGMLITVLAAPWFMGALFGVLTLVGLVFAIVAAVRGNADAEWKVLGFLHFVALMALLLIMSIYCFLVPNDPGAADDYLSYLFVVGTGLGIASGVNGIFATVQRSSFYVVGFVFLIINGSWGFIGNLLGLMTHFASIYSYKDFGKRHSGSDRICFVCYEKGFSLKSNAAGRFAFTQGAVMSADTSTLRKHEGIHVGQHYLFGPIYPLSHFLWFVAMLLPGMIGAYVKKLGAGEGITRMSYYDNPWEVIAYGIANETDRSTTDALVWSWWVSILVTVLYVVACTAAFFVWLIWRL